MIAFTDGSCLKNGSETNTGGFGVVLLNDDGSFHSCYQKQADNTTNNEMELKASLYVFMKYGHLRPAPTIYSDSAYCVNSLNEWIFNWARNGWIKSDKKPPENLEIMKVFYDFYQKGYKMNLVKVKGHHGVLWNEIADGLATGKLAAADVERKYNGGNH
jgi:ribonuclease HI